MAGMARTLAGLSLACRCPPRPATSRRGSNHATSSGAGRPRRRDRHSPPPGQPGIVAAALRRAPASSGPPGGGGCDGRADTCGGPALPWRSARLGPGSPPVIHSLPPDRKAGWSAICARIESGYRRLPGSRYETISRLHATTAVQVFSGLHPVACGQAVNKPVDNRREMRITARFLWIPSWIAENKKWLAAGPCAAFAGEVIMFLPLETGTTWGWPRERGRSRETGLLVRVPGPGGRRAASARPASWSAWRGEAGQAPPSHTWRGLA